MPRLIRRLLLRVPAVRRQLSRIADLESQLQQLRAQLTASAAEAKERHVQLDTLERKAAQAAAQIADLESQLQQLRAQLAASAAEAKERHVQLDTLERKAAQAATLQMQVKELGEQLEALRADFARSAPLEADTIELPEEEHPATLGQERPPAIPCTFDRLLNDRTNNVPVRLLFFVHVPKAAGNTVASFLTRNDFRRIELHPESNSFFHWTDERQWFERYHDPTSQPTHVFTGHFRLDHAIFRQMGIPFGTVTMLRHPIERMLSAYNSTLRVFHSPWHEDIVSGGMSFVDFVRNFVSAFGPQYSYFDDSGTGSLDWTGKKTSQECLHNLLTKVAFYGFTDRFDEFAVILAYLLRLDVMMGLHSFNVTKEIPDKTGLPLKNLITDDERLGLDEILREDISFYEQARSEYDRRVSNPQLKAILKDTAPLVKSLRETMERYLAVEDPACPGRRAFRDA